MISYPWFRALSQCSFSIALSVQPSYEYYKQCSAEKEYYCAYYSMGVFEGAAMANIVAEKTTGHLLYVETENTTVGPKMMVVLKWMANNPTKLNHPTSAVIAGSTGGFLPYKVRNRIARNNSPAYDYGL